jgi:hypothetical protein
VSAGPRPGGWQIRGIERAEEAVLRRAAIVELLMKRPGLTAEEIADAVVASLDVTRKDLRLMLDGGAVRRERTRPKHPTVRLYRWSLA